MSKVRICKKGNDFLVEELNDQDQWICRYSCFSLETATHKAHELLEPKVILQEFN